MSEEEKTHKIKRRKFYAKLMNNLLAGLCAIGLCLTLGMMGYHYIEDLDWIDAYMNAAMILSGMGPVATIKTFSGKLFAGTYALFSGIIFLLIIGLIFAPVFHRVFLKLHIEDKK